MSYFLNSRDNHDFYLHCELSYLEQEGDFIDGSLIFSLYTLSGSV